MPESPQQKPMDRDEPHSHEVSPCSPRKKSPDLDHETEEGGGPFTCCKCCANTWNDDDWCDECVAESRAGLMEENRDD